MKVQTTSPTIRFETKLFKIGSWTIMKLPKSSSAKLPSRGQVMVEGTINSVPFQNALEPDGNGSHWLNVDEKMQKAINVKAGNAVTLAIKSSKKWPEPKIPADIQNALKTDKPAQTLWMEITPMARWEWIRWIRATSQAETRQRRIGVALSKLKAGDRRPCCFNTAMCTEPAVSKSGVLLDPS